MAFDGLVLSAVAKELGVLLLGGRIDKVQQPSDHDLVLSIRKDRTTYKLLLSANKSYPRVHITARFNTPNPAMAPMFCMLLRKHLEGARIVNIMQWSRERILFIDVEGHDELGERAVRRLVIEIMGKHSNLLLLDKVDGVIIDAISHVSSRVNRFREILPGRPYVYPPSQDKMDPFVETKDGFRNKRAAQAQVPLAKFLVENYLGVSPFFGKEAAFRASHDTDECEVFFALIALCKQHREPAVMVDSGKNMSGFYLFPILHTEAVAQITDSVNDCLDTYYSERALADIAHAKAGAYLRQIRTEREKTAVKIAKFEQLLAKKEDAELWRISGELLTAYLHQVKKGQVEVSLPNFYEEETPLCIPLNPALTALENANAYFKRYTKYKKGIGVTEEQLAMAKEELLYLDSVLHELETCSVQDIPFIEEELRLAGYIRKDTAAPKKKAAVDKKERKFSPARYLSSEGIAIMVGKNNQENDAITFKAAKKTDIWLHVKDAPGSHVIVEHPNPPEQTLKEAAMLAVYFSRLRDSSKVPVDVVPVKNLWKPNKARPGFVLFTGQQTMLMQIDQDILQPLLKSRSLTSRNA